MPILFCFSAALCCHETSQRCAKPPATKQFGDRADEFAKIDLHAARDLTELRAR